MTKAEAIKTIMDNTDATEEEARHYYSVYGLNALHIITTK